jgi:hypothetical protein
LSAPIIIYALGFTTKKEAFWASFSAKQKAAFPAASLVIEV